MAETDPGAVSAMQAKIWCAEAWSYYLDENFWSASGMLGSGLGDMTKPVYYVDSFSKTDAGDKAVMTLILDLEGDGIAGDDITVDRDEAITFDTVEITVDQLSKPTKNKGRMSERKTVQKFRGYAKDRVGRWMAQTNTELQFLVGSGTSFAYRYDGRARPAGGIRQLKYASDVSAPTSLRKGFPGTVTATSGLASTDKMSWNFLSSMRTKAERARLPALKYKGSAKWIVVMSPEQGRDLRADTDYRSAIQNGGVRGSENPAFTGAFADVEGLVLYTHPRVTNTLGAASGSKYGASGTVDGACALLLGANAMAYAKVGNDIWYEGDENRGSQMVFQLSIIQGMLKPHFVTQYGDGTEQDYGVMALYTAAAA